MPEKVETEVNSNSSTKTYADGLMEGKVEGLGRRVDKAETRLDRHSDRLSRLEKIAYVVMGSIVLIQYAPTLTAFLKQIAN